MPTQRIAFKEWLPDQPNTSRVRGCDGLVMARGHVQRRAQSAIRVEAEGGAVQNTGMVTAYLSGTVSKYSGMNTLSVELLERSDPNFYAELTQQ